MRVALLTSLSVFACSTPTRDRDDDDDDGSGRSGNREGALVDCVAAYDSLIETGRVVLGMKGLAAGDSERIEFIPLPDTRTGSLVEQINRFHGPDGPQDGRDYFDCNRGVVGLSRFDIDGGRYWFDYDPPLSWSKVPLRAGNSWTWTGVRTFECRVSQECEPEMPSRATVRYEVGAMEPLQTAVGTLNTFPLHMEWTDVDQARPSIVQTTWFLAESPMVMVHREQKFQTEPGEFVEGTWFLMSIENPPD